MEDNMTAQIVQFPKMQRWDVYSHDGYWIDTVQYSSEMSHDDVFNKLMAEGFLPNIFIERI